MACKYEKVLDNATVMYRAGNKDVKQILEQLFPELKESGDERIRQKLLFLCYSWRNNEQVNIPDKKEVEKTIAWLEKQGETSRQQRVEEAMQEVEGKASEEILTEMRGEQKPNVCEGCNNVKGCVACVDGSEWAHIEEQKPTAWSKEDEDCLLDVNTAVDDYFGEGFAEQYCDWIKVLKERVQPQNAWRPSEKQMEILSIYADQNNSHGAVLTSLYQDLKKLKG